MPLAVVFFIVIILSNSDSALHMHSFSSCNIGNSSCGNRTRSLSQSPSHSPTQQTPTTTSTSSNSLTLSRRTRSVTTSLFSSSSSASPSSTRSSSAHTPSRLSTERTTSPTATKLQTPTLSASHSASFATPTGTKHDNAIPRCDYIGAEVRCTGTAIAQPDLNQGQAPVTLWLKNVAFIPAAVLTPLIGTAWTSVASTPQTVPLTLTVTGVSVASNRMSLTLALRDSEYYATENKTYSFEMSPLVLECDGASPLSCTIIIAAAATASVQELQRTAAALVVSTVLGALGGTCAIAVADAQMAALITFTACRSKSDREAFSSLNWLLSPMPLFNNAAGRVASNLLLVFLVAIIHGLAAVVLWRTQHRPALDTFGTALFPTVTLYVVNFVLPGTAFNAFFGLMHPVSDPTDDGMKVVLVFGVIFASCCVAGHFFFYRKVLSHRQFHEGRLELVFLMYPAAIQSRAYRWHHRLWEQFIGSFFRPLGRWAPRRHRWLTDGIAANLLPEWTVFVLAVPLRTIVMAFCLAVPTNEEQTHCAAQLYVASGVGFFFVLLTLYARPYRSLCLNLLSVMSPCLLTAYLLFSANKVLTTVTQSSTTQWDVAFVTLLVGVQIVGILHTLVLWYFETFRWRLSPEVRTLSQNVWVELNALEKTSLSMLNAPSPQSNETMSM